MSKALLMLGFISLSYSTQASTFNYAKFDSLLQAHVKNGRVDYKTLKKADQQLQHYLSQLENIDPTEFEQWPPNEKLAFWINAYNAITIEGILRHYPIQSGNLIARARFPQNSIRQIAKFWDTVFINVMGSANTLNQIEHEILRKQFDEPRIHFVIVCASIGCPGLESRAFVPESIDQRLENASQHFINDTNHVRLNKEKNILYLSAIFDWYKADFKPTKTQDEIYKTYKSNVRGIVAFVADRLSQEDRQYIINRSPKIKYLDYDWTLNEQ